MTNPQVTKWNARYRDGEWEDVPPHLLVSKAADSLQRGDALDIACGAGRHALALAARGWQVTALDASSAALEIVQARAAAQGLSIKTVCADCEDKVFSLPDEAYDLIVVANYLHRPLFAQVRKALRVGGLFVATIAMIDDDPQIKPMNPAFLLQPGELRSHFADWELLHHSEAKLPQRRSMAEIIVRRIE